MTPLEFKMHHFDQDLKITYNTLTHIQTVEVKKLKLINYQEVMDYVMISITHQKNFVYALYQAV